MWRRYAGGGNKQDKRENGATVVNETTKGSEQVGDAERGRSPSVDARGDPGDVYVGNFSRASEEGAAEFSSGPTVSGVHE